MQQGFACERGPKIAEEGKDPRTKSCPKNENSYEGSLFPLPFSRRAKRGKNYWKKCAVSPTSLSSFHLSFETGRNQANSINKNIIPYSSSLFATPQRHTSSASSIQSKNYATWYFMNASSSFSKAADDERNDTRSKEFGEQDFPLRLIK